jgi:alpha 1,6-mannosyltransferase
MALKPIEDWIPAIYRKNVSLVVGVEYDKLDGVRWQDWTLDLQFASWTVMAKPGHMLLGITVERVIERLRKLAQNQGCTISEVKPSYREVLDTTGPALFTEAVFEGLSYTTGTNFGSHNITGMTEPRLVGDVLILPINAFGSGQKHSNSGDPDSDSALVKHLFKGSWKKDHTFSDAKQAEVDAEAEAEAKSEPTSEPTPKAELEEGEGDGTANGQDLPDLDSLDTEAVGHISESEP